MFHSHVSKWISNDFEKIFFPLDHLINIRYGILAVPRF